MEKIRFHKFFIRHGFDEQGVMRTFIQWNYHWKGESKHAMFEHEYGMDIISKPVRDYVREAILKYLERHDAPDESKTTD
jgi:hypothetical protein